MKGSFGGWFILTVIILFLISLILLAPRVLVNEFLIKKDWKIVIWLKSAGEKSIFSWIFNIQLVLSFIVYSFFLGNPFMDGRHFGLYYYLALFFLPCFLLYIYREFHKKAKFEYICQVINEEIFNAAKPILKYSLDKDRTVFSSLGNDDLILYDKSSNTYFKFEKVNNEDKL